MKIVAVCSCPSGVAHTYMACEALEDAARKLKMDIKVESQGAIGIENEIVADEVKEADFVVLTNDVKIRKEKRFEGKKVFYESSNHIIRNADTFLEKCIKEVNGQ